MRFIRLLMLRKRRRFLPIEMEIEVIVEKMVEMEVEVVKEPLI